MLNLLMSRDFPGVLVVKKKKKKNLPAVQEMRVRSLGLEDPLEKETATYSSILDWRILWTVESCRL